jgi:hypothetical protein
MTRSYAFDFFHLEPLAKLSPEERAKELGKYEIDAVHELLHHSITEQEAKDFGAMFIERLKMQLPENSLITMVGNAFFKKTRDDEKMAADLTMSGIENSVTGLALAVKANDKESKKIYLEHLKQVSDHYSGKENSVPPAETSFIGKVKETLSF